MHYPANESVCPHCSGLTDLQLREIKLKRRSQGTGNAMLDRVIIYALGLVVVGVVIYKLNQVS